jgi:hypothetical protein
MENAGLCGQLPLNYYSAVRSYVFRDYYSTS